MKMKVFSIFDAAARAYLPPFVLPEVGMAERAFRDCVGSSDHQFGKHPEDYTLYQVAFFEDSTGKFEVLIENNKIVSGAELYASIRERRLSHGVEPLEVVSGDKAAD